VKPGVWEFGLGLWSLARSIGVACAGLWVVYWLATLPWRRAERCRLFLDVLGLGLADGKSPEHAIVEACATRDRAIPVRMHLVAACIERGNGLAAALGSARGFLPADVQGTLEWGARNGRLADAVALLREGGAARPNATRGGMVVVGTMLLWPGSTALVFLTIRTVIFPKFRQIAADFGVDPFAGMAGWVFEWGWLLAAGVLALKLLWYVLAFGRTGGHWLGRFLPLDWLGRWLPWRRQRLQRRFAQLLALGLDLGVAEDEALVAAGAGTGDDAWRCRALDGAAALRSGIPLDEAVAAVDRTPEFRWRLGLALQRARRTMDSLKGWLDDLESRADRNETLAAQSFLVFSVLSNAALVALTAVSVYAALTAMIEGAAS
jgi:hypothetical protein